MSEQQGGANLTLTLSAAAAEMGVSSDTVWRWAEAGELPVFIPPGVKVGTAKPGPRGYKIWRADWELFKRRRTFVGGLAVDPDPQPAAPAATGLVRQRRAR